tara:strand:- start:159 stop:659 length:501 start_codon:yes stop_codon:yes gene_type:complete
LKLTNALVSSTSKTLDKATGTINAVKDEVSAQVLSWLNDKADAETFFTWLTDNAVPVKGETKVEKLDRGQSNKNFQNIVNQTPFQRQYFKIEKGKPLTEELRVKKANQPMVTDGRATQGEKDDGRYHAFIRTIDTTPATPLEVLMKLKKSSGLSNKKLASLCNTLP